MKTFIFQEMITRTIQKKNPSYETNQFSYQFTINKSYDLVNTVYVASTDVLIYGSNQ